MLDFIGLFCFYFLLLIKYVIYIDIVLSWLPILWVEVRVPFFSAILTPVYSRIKKVISLDFNSVDFTPIVALILIFIAQSLVVAMFPYIQLSF